jgi:hypothetical protein
MGLNVSHGAPVHKLQSFLPKGDRMALVGAHRNDAPQEFDVLCPNRRLL